VEGKKNLITSVLGGQPDDGPAIAISGSPTAARMALAILQARGSCQRNEFSAQWK
jgi:hypothetical protein